MLSFKISFNNKCTSLGLVSKRSFAGPMEVHLLLGSVGGSTDPFFYLIFNLTYNNNYFIILDTQKRSKTIGFSLIF